MCKIFPIEALRPTHQIGNNLEVHSIKKSQCSKTHEPGQRTTCYFCISVAASFPFCECQQQQHSVEVMEIRAVMRLHLGWERALRGVESWLLVAMVISA